MLDRAERSNFQYLAPYHWRPPDYRRLLPRDPISSSVSSDWPVQTPFKRRAPVPTMVPWIRLPGSYYVLRNLVGVARTGTSQSPLARKLLTDFAHQLDTVSGAPSRQRYRHNRMSHHSGHSQYSNPHVLASGERNHRNRMTQHNCLKLFPQVPRGES